MVHENIPMKFFVGVAVDEKAPNPSAWTACQARLKANGQEKAFEELLQEILQIACEKVIVFGSVQVADSVHVEAHVDPRKEEERKREGEEPRDPGARWGAKGKRRVQTEGGETKEVTEYFYGYKAHVSLNAATGLDTCVVPTAGNVPDGKVLIPLVEKDLEQGVPVEVVSADRAYDDVDNHLFLWSRGDSLGDSAEGDTDEEEGSEQGGVAEASGDAGVLGRAEGAVQGGAEVWGGEGAAWVAEVSVCRVDRVCHPGISDGHRAEPEAVGEVAGWGTEF